MGYELQRLATTGELAYIGKHNANYGLLESFMNSVQGQLASMPNAAANLPAALTVLFGASPAVIGATSYQPTIAGLRLNIAGGAAWLPGLGAVVGSGSVVQLDLTTAADGTYYVSADALGVPVFRSEAADALYSVVKSGGALSSLTRVASVAWAFSDWSAAQSSAALGNFASLDGRLEAIETAYTTKEREGAVNGVAQLGADGKVPISQLPTTLATDAEVASAIGDALAEYDPAAALGAQPYDLPLFYPGKPGDAALMLKIKMVRAVTLPINLTGSAGDVGTNPTATTTFTLKQNGVTIGTVSVSTIGAVTFTFAAPVVLAIGDVLSLWNQATADATLANISITLAGTR